MLLFEMFASLGLDTTTFRQQADEAVGEGKEVAQSVTDSFRHVQTEADTVDEKLNDLEEKSETTNAIVNGLTEATGQIIEKGIEMIIDFGKESIEAAASTGSELANAFNAASEKWNLSLDAIKLKTGEALLPIATAFYDLLSTLTGVTDADLLLQTLGQIQQYEFDNIEQLNASLDGVFGRFEEAQAVEAGNVGDMTAALKSQADYWADYADTLEALKGRNIDPQFLADIADGSKESLETLKALEAADATQLAKLAESYEAVQATKEAAAQSMHEVQIAVDEDLLEMTKSVEKMVASMNQEDAAEANAKLTGMGIANGLASSAPAITAWVNHINNEIARIGNAPAAGTYAYRLAVASGDYDIPHASGLRYVPYDGYRAELHRGEAVLTSQQADTYRANRSGGEDMTQLLAAVRELGDRIASMSITMNGRVVGDIATETTSRSIAADTREQRRYG